MKNQLGLIVFLLLTCSCCNRNHPKENENFKSIQIDVENCKTSIDLKLSDLVDSCWLVKLETTSESVLGNYFHYIFIDNDFIIIVDLNGIYKFAYNGKFIKKIITFGRGPNEFNTNPQLYYSTDAKILYINANFGNTSIVSRFDVKSQEFLDPVKKCFPGMWGNFIVLNDSLIMGSVDPFYTNSNPYALFIQNLKGDFISGIESKSKVISVKNESILQRMLIYSGGDVIHAKYFFADTLYRIIDNNVHPWLIITGNNPPAETFSIMKMGEKRSSYERFENPSFMIFKILTYEGMVPFKDGAQKAEYDTSYFFINKSNGKYALIKSYMDDLTNKLKVRDIAFPSSLPNNLIYTFYYPYELKKRNLQIFKEDLLPKAIYNQLDSILPGLKETDNPVLFIGVPKKDVSILN
jgi:hypothetical protein